MAPVITSVHVDQLRLDIQSSFLVTAIVTDADIVYCKINDLIFQMEVVGSKYWTRISAYTLGVHTGPITVYAVKTATSEVVSLAYGEDIVIAEIEAILPATFLKNLYLGSSTYKWMGIAPTVLEITEEKRIDKTATNAIIIKEGKQIRENRNPRHHYKNVVIPLIIDTTHIDSYSECRRMFEQDVLNTEEFNLNLEGFNPYSRIEIMDDGQNVSVRGYDYYKIVHTIRLIIHLKKVNIEGA